MTKLLLLLLMFSFSCSSHQKMIDQHVVAGTCDKEFKKISLTSAQGLWETVEESSGKSASYLVSGLGYSTDVIVTFTGGLVGSVAMCSPFLMAETLSQNSHYGSASGHCLFSVGGTIIKKINPELGDKAYESTSQWRCPQVDPVAEALLEVSSCYEKKGERELAEKQVDEIINSEVFNSCLSKKVKARVAESKKRLF